MVITSTHNERLKALRKLRDKRERDRTGLFVAEGEDLLDAAEAAGWESVERYGLGGVEVAPELLASVSALGSGTRALAVYRQRWAERATGDVCLALWGVHDPGNVGTAIRSALAFGAASVALGPDCADPYGPKAVRAAMGAIFEVPVARVGSIAELPGEKVALVARGGEPLASLNTGEPLASLDAGSAPHECRTGIGSVTLVVGGEREGLPDAVLAACDRTAHIPIARADSLNAAMAATVALYEVSRP
jgi:TrmH family RNA methyltransferase